MQLRNAQVSLVSVVLGCMLCSCGTEQPRPGSDPPVSTRVTEASRTAPVDPPKDESSRRPQLVQNRQAPVAPDLQRLVKTFVRYAVGDSDTLPHRESVSMALGGQVVLSIDDIVAALPNREIWKICPDGWDLYGASSCPVDLLGPIADAGVNDASLIYSANFGEVTCAPSRRGPLPRGRLVVLRPSQEWRTCASDFALVLAADEQGLLRHIDLTLSEP